MNIRAALDRIVAIEAGLMIAEPFLISVKRAFKYVPKASQSVTEYPVFYNVWTFVGEKRASNLRTQLYTVNMQLLAAPIEPDQDIAADIASAFHDALVNAFDGDVTLNGTVTRQELRGGDPTLVRFQPGGSPSFMGLNLFLDIQMIEPKTFG